MAVKGDYECFTDEWRRTDPDLILHLPRVPVEPAEHVDHVLVEYTPGGALLAIWTMQIQGPGRDGQVVCARSQDDGRTWTPTQRIAGGAETYGLGGMFGFPIMSKSGRIYCVYNASPGIGRSRSNAVLRCHYSDDDGRTWIDGEIEIPYRRTKRDHPDPKVPGHGIVWQAAIRDAKDRPIVPISRSASPEVVPLSDASHLGGGPTAPFQAPRPHEFGDVRSEFLRFDNADEGPDPRDLEVTFLPDSEDLIPVPCTFEPQASLGVSFAQEPGIVLLPDGRLFTEMRTANGNLWYTVSDNDGHSWRPTEVLRFRDDGDPMLNPIAPSPIYRFEDGRYLLFLQNHDGYGYGGLGPLNLNSRRPQFMAVGEYRESAHQPIWFSEPMLFCDTDNVGVFPNYLRWQSMYSSLSERPGHRIFWYTDRKLFALGRYITDELLGGLRVPS